MVQHLDSGTYNREHWIARRKQNFESFPASHADLQTGLAKKVWLKVVVAYRRKQT